VSEEIGKGDEEGDGEQEAEGPNVRHRSKKHKANQRCGNEDKGPAIGVHKQQISKELRVGTRGGFGPPTRRSLAGILYNFSYQ
jgi:hypothetical protein